jgi:hypothetical protein
MLESGEMEIYLTVSDPVDGELQVGLVGETFETQHRLWAAHPKRPIRFCVGEPGRRSTIWRIWAGKNKSDIYVASRKTAGIFKVSLHESGDWRIQWVRRDESVRFTPYDEKHIDDGRIIHKWARTPSSGGWTDALSIWVPGTEVVSVPGDSEPYKDVQWMEAPPAGSAVEFRIVFLQSHSAYRLGSALIQPESSHALVNGFFLRNGEVMLVLARTSPMTKEQMEGVHEIHEGAAGQSAQDFDMDPATGPRAAVFAVDSDGYTNIWDLALVQKVDDA